MQLYGAHMKNGIRRCDRCNANISYRNNRRVVAQFDLRKSYGNLLLCKRCTSVIQVEYIRQ